MTDRQRLLAVCAAVGVLAVAAVLVRSQWFHFPVGYELTGYMVSNAGLAIQLGALCIGIAAIHAFGPHVARWVIATEGVACTLGYGLPGFAYLVVVALWYWALTRPRGRAALLAVLFVAFEATAWTSFHEPGFLFSRLFTLRLLLFAWDRWQNDFARAAPLDYAAYMLLPPLVILPSLVTIVPFFGGVAQKITVGMSRARARAVARHFLLAVAFAPVTLLLVYVPAATGIPRAALRFAEAVAHTAVFGHLTIALLLLHGIEERLPLRRPLLATSYVELWSRYLVHLKDLQVALFYTPALLACRRLNRYAGILVAIAWTMLVGNFVIHAVVGYGFYIANGTLSLERMGWLLLQNAAIGVALACELCLHEWRRCNGAPPPAVWRSVLGWATTMTIATSVSAMS
jgi:hypothetical protein